MPTEPTTQALLDLCNKYREANDSLLQSGARIQRQNDRLLRLLQDNRETLQVATRSMTQMQAELAELRAANSLLRHQALFYAKLASNYHTPSSN